MKLLRYGPPGEEKPAILGEDGVVYDISGAVGDITPQTLSDGLIGAAARFNLARLPVIENPGRIGPPVREPRKFIGIGLNYSDHAAEVRMDRPSEPVVFTKHTSCIVGPDDDVVLPAWSQKGDWEVELGVIIGRTARDVPEERALDFVAGYTLVNDVSERAAQLEGTGQWVKGKSFDTFGPVGPWLVTKEEIPDPQDIALELRLNGALMQKGSTASMFFTVAELVSYLSRHFTLTPGDIIATGTPAGVGLGRRPQVFLRPGDMMELRGAGLGAQRQRVRRA